MSLLVVKLVLSHICLSKFQCTPSHLLQDHGVCIAPVFAGNDGEGKVNVLMFVKGCMEVEVLYISYDKFYTQGGNGGIEELF